MKRKEEDLKLTPDMNVRFPDHGALYRIADGVQGGGDVGDSGDSGALRLRPDMNVVFEDKEALKRRSILKPLAWVGGAAVAAAVALIVMLHAPVQGPAAGVAGTTAVAGADTAVVKIAPAVPVAPVVEEVIADNAVKENRVRQAVKPVRKIEAPQPESGNVPESGNESTGVSTPVEVSAPAGELIAEHIEPVVEEPKIPVEQVEAGRQAEKPLVAERTERPTLQQTLQQTVTEAIPPLPALNTAALLAPVDQIIGQGLITVNRLLKRPATEVRQYDPDGKLVYYAVETRNINMERNYKN